MRVSAFDPKDILLVIVDPEFEHSRELRTEAVVKRIFDCEANNLQQSWRFDWEPPKAVLRDVWTIDWILGC